METNKITQAEFDALYLQHQEWLADKTKPKPSFAYLDLTDIKFPEEVNLKGADLTGVNLFKANLELANLTRTDLKGADLTKADLKGTNLKGADLTRADLTEAILFRAILTGTNLRKVTISENNYQYAKIQGAILDERESTEDLLQEQIKRLEQERIKLLASNEDKKAELEQSAMLIEQFKKEADALNKKKVGKIDNAFDQLKNANAEIKKEIGRLNKMFWVYAGLSVFLLAIIVFIANSYYCKNIVNGESFNYSKALSYTPLVLIFAGFIWVFLQGLHRAQRQLVILREFTNKINVIESILKAYAHTHSEEDTADKMAAMLDEYVRKMVYTPFDLDALEKRKIDNDAKETNQLTAMLNTITELVGSVKELVSKITSSK